LSNFEEIRRIVMEEPQLMAAFSAADTDAELFARVIALGNERGLEVSAVELKEVVRANRRAWLERWLV
jgi:predicted GNAT superfamily acetyltransferase